MQQFSSLGQFVGPPVVAWVALQAGGWQFTWVVTGACSLLGLWVALQLQAAWRHRPVVA
jgi:MFS family permease